MSNKRILQDFGDLATFIQVLCQAPTGNENVAPLKHVLVVLRQTNGLDFFVQSYWRFQQNQTQIVVQSRPTKIWMNYKPLESSYLLVLVTIKCPHAKSKVKICEIVLYKSVGKKCSIE